MDSGVEERAHFPTPADKLFAGDHLLLCELLAFRLVVTFDPGRLHCHGRIL